MKSREKKQRDLKVSDQVIDDYLFDRLSEKERMNFEERCFNDTVLFEELKVREQVFKRIKEEPELLLVDKEQVYLEPEPNMFEELWSRISPQRPLWVYPILVLIPIVFVLGSYQTYLIYEDQQFWKQFEYDTAEPYEYHPNILRSTEKQELNYELFLDRFETCIDYYKAWNYDDVISIFKEMQPNVSILQSNAEFKNQFRDLRDYYFYFGLSHFAISRTPAEDLSEDKRLEHAEKTIALLTEAESLTLKYDLMNQDGVFYFLGLAYGFNDKHERAIEKLHQIKSDSEFYTNATKLIEKWS